MRTVHAARRAVLPSTCRLRTSAERAGPDLPYASLISLNFSVAAALPLFLSGCHFWASL